MPGDAKTIEVTPDPSPPSSSPADIKDDCDSGLPSSSPLDDNQEYMLDGFDFSTGVSICQTLASESDDEIDSNSLSDKNQLASALMNVLNISKGDQNELSNRPLRAMTLDEIEEPHPQDGDHDQTAFNMLLAAMKSPRGSEPVSQQRVREVCMPRPWLISC